MEQGQKDVLVFICVPLIALILAQDFEQPLGFDVTRARLVADVASIDPFGVAVAKKPTDVV